MRITPALAALTLTLALGLAGCSDDDTVDSAMRDGTHMPDDSASTDHNNTDVAFATEMIQHHAQALQMVDMTVGRDLDPKFEELTVAIRDAQAPEIEAMSDWLQDWNEKVPSTVRDHVNSHGTHDMEGMDDTGMGMPGMMSQDDMDQLADASDASFEDMWLSMMIEHHEGAIEMAELEQTEGEYAPAVELAKDIVASQSVEIDTMRALLS